MIHAPPGASVIEFPMAPHIDRCYGYMAMALGLDYWIVPGISAFFLGQYEMTPEGAAAVVRLVRHILDKKKMNVALHGGNHASHQDL